MVSRLGRKILATLAGLTLLLGVVGLLIVATQRIVLLQPFFLRALAEIAEVVVGLILFTGAVFLTLRLFVFLLDGQSNS